MIPPRQSSTIVRRPRPGAVLLAVAGRLGLAAGKGAIVAVITWFVGREALANNTSPYVPNVAIGAGIAFILATIYFVIWPNPLGDPRSWDEIIDVPPPPYPEDEQQSDELRPRS
jgi:hypothetical protein